LYQKNSSTKNWKCTRFSLTQFLFISSSHYSWQRQTTTHWRRKYTTI